MALDYTKEPVKSIYEIIESIRIYVNQDGGDLELVDYKEGYVYIRVLGACVGCSLIDATYKDGLERIFLEEVPGVKGFKIIEDQPMIIDNLEEVKAKIAANQAKAKAQNVSKKSKK